jgi:hypothetical protein
MEQTWRDVYKNLECCCESSNSAALGAAKRTRQSTRRHRRGHMVAEGFSQLGHRKCAYVAIRSVPPNLSNAAPSPNPPNVGDGAEFVSPTRTANMAQAATGQW